MERKALSRITKISEQNLERIAALKVSGYEPNDYIIGLALELLEERRKLIRKKNEKRTIK